MLFLLLSPTLHDDHLLELSYLHDDTTFKLIYNFF